MNEQKTIIRLNKRIKELEDRIERKDREISSLRKENRRRGKEKTLARGRAKKIVAQHEKLLENVKEIHEELSEEYYRKLEESKEPEEQEDVIIFDARGKERRIKKCSNT